VHNQGFADFSAKLGLQQPETKTSRVDYNFSYDSDDLESSLTREKSNPMNQQKSADGKKGHQMAHMACAQPGYCVNIMISMFSSGQSMFL
jgi:hypothetical protein